MTHEEKQIHNAVHAELREFEEFKELVKRMREAQRECDALPCDCAEVERLGKKAEVIEQAVDNWLEKNM